MNSKGFTLIEVLSVLVILSMVYLIAMPSLNTVDRTRNMSFISNCKLISSRAYIMSTDDNYSSYFNNGKIFVKDINGISNLKDPYDGEIKSDSYVLFKDELEEGVKVSKTYIYIKTCNGNKCHVIGDINAPVSDSKLTYKDVKEISN